MAGMTLAPVPRRLAPEEWPLARDLRVAALSDAPDAFGSTVDRERSLPASAWRERLSGNAWFAVFHAAEPVGLACGVRLGAPEERELTGVWVAPRARGTGVGDALVAAVRDWARGEGADRLTLVSPRATRRRSASTGATGSRPQRSRTPAPPGTPPGTSPGTSRCAST